MKPLLKFVAFIIMILCLFWVGMQWWARPDRTETNPIIPEVSPIIPVIVPESESSEDPLPVEEEEIPEPSLPVTNTTIDPNLPKNPTDKVIRYDSSRFKYGFEMPANVYYSAFPGESGAVHTVGIGIEDPEILADAAVRVYFYGKKVLPELQNSTKYMSPDGTSVYLLVNGASVKIEALNINHSVVQKIIETFTAQ